MLESGRRGPYRQASPRRPGALPARQLTMKIDLGFTTEPGHALRGRTTDGLGFPRLLLPEQEGWWPREPGVRGPWPGRPVVRRTGPAGTTDAPGRAAGEGGRAGRA